MTSHDQLLDEIEAFLKATGMNAIAFGRRSVNNGKLVARMRAGSSVTLHTADAIRAFIAAQCERDAPRRRQRRAA